MVLIMRIDGSNLLLAAQVQTRPAATVKPAQNALELSALDAKPAAATSKPTGLPGFKRLGQQLDIKI